MTLRSGVFRPRGRPSGRAVHRSASSPRSLAGTALAAVLAASLLVVTVPGPTAPTMASWNDAEWTSGSLGTDSFDCGADTNYSTTASARFLSGSLLGTNLDSVAELAGVTATRNVSGAAPVTPTTSLVLATGDPATDAYANPLPASALNGVVGLDLTGLTLGLPGGSAGALNQYARVSTDGTSAGASGLVNNSGGVGVTAGTPSSELPESATLSLAQALPVVSGVTDARLEIGAVAASSQLDWCAALLSQVWGDGTISGVTRDYGIAGLDLVVDSPLVSDLVGSVNGTIAGLEAAVTDLSGTNGLINSTIRSALLASGLLGTLGLGSITGTVTVADPQLASAVGTLLTTPLSDGTVTINLVDGTVAVNLATLLGDSTQGINNLAPNTELVLTSAVLNPLAARVGALLDAWTVNVTAAVTDAVNAAVLSVESSVTISLPPVLGVAVEVLRLDIGLRNVNAGDTSSTTVGDVLAGRAALAIVPTTLGVGLGGVTALVTGLTASLVAPVSTLLTTQLLTPVSSLGAALAAASAPIVTALGSVVAALPSLLSLAVNVQPDQAGALPGPGYSAAVPPRTSAEYRVSALRIGLLDSVGSAGFVYAHLATATAGVNARLP
ncbi:hypothetical protein D6T64_10100 [Cryobacterium melibiosiphilum]|uniref:Choice-of-anchor G family protein n=1 Tax=Cryobacterium melibiosiphilum TaxID=995039 RepID=A0A3A5MGD9_9MICO|nr:choice-of-anchor G family protein [Cryobacterium melibiosiphilum]RJT88482.1 hypothetical protein D6T64_10100 [Cryobacterium melibiosiphilum]